MHTKLSSFLKSVMIGKKKVGRRNECFSRGYDDIIQYFDLIFYLKVFSGVLLQSIFFFEIMQTIGNDISYCSKKSGRI
jgi:hypothetical protein